MYRSNLGLVFKVERVCVPLDSSLTGPLGPASTVVKKKTKKIVADVPYVPHLVVGRGVPGAVLALVAREREFFY